MLAFNTVFNPIQHFLPKQMSDLPVVSRTTSQAEPATLKDNRLNLLWPTPQKVTQGEGAAFFPKDTLPIYLSNNTNDDTGKS